MIKRKLFAEKFKSIFNTKSWPWKSEFCYLSSVLMDFLQTSFQKKSSTALFIILISGQCCTLLWMPNLSFKSWMDSYPSVISLWYGDKRISKRKILFTTITWSVHEEIGYCRNAPWFDKKWWWLKMKGMVAMHAKSRFSYTLWPMLTIQYLTPLHTATWMPVARSIFWYCHARFILVEQSEVRSSQLFKAYS